MQTSHSNRGDGLRSTIHPVRVCYVGNQTDGYGYSVHSGKSGAGVDKVFYVNDYQGDAQTTASHKAQEAANAHAKELFIRVYCNGHDHEAEERALAEAARAAKAAKTTTTLTLDKPDYVHRPCDLVADLIPATV